MPSGKGPAPCFCENMAIVSFTERGFALSLRMREAFAGEEGVKPLENTRPESGSFKSACADPQAMQAQPEADEFKSECVYQQAVRSQSVDGAADSVCVDYQENAEKPEAGTDQSTSAGKLPQVRLYTARKAVAAAHPEAVYTEGGLSAWCGRQFSDRETDAILFIGACGIAVRTIAPFLVSKTCDPAVLVSDENGNHIISLLSGHLGGGNGLAVWLAGKLGADPVITTASDTQGLPAIDMLAKKNRLVIADMELAKEAAAELVNGKKILLCCSGSVEGKIPAGFLFPEDQEGVPGFGTAPEHSGESGEDPGGLPASCVSAYKLWISPHTDFPDPEHTLQLVPRCLILGIGCKRGKTARELYDYVRDLFLEKHLSLFAVGTLASASRKADEPGLLALAGLLGAQFVTFSPEELCAVPGKFTGSEFVRQTVGADNVCERAATAALPCEEQARARFLCRKTAGNGITAAVVEQKWGITFE